MSSSQVKEINLTFLVCRIKKMLVSKLDFPLTVQRFLDILIVKEAGQSVSY